MVAATREVHVGGGGRKCLDLTVVSDIAKRLSLSLRSCAVPTIIPELMLTVMKGIIDTLLNGCHHVIFFSNAELQFLASDRLVHACWNLREDIVCAEFE